MRSVVLWLVPWLAATPWLATLSGPRTAHCVMALPNCQPGATVWSQLCNGLLFGGALVALVVVARIALSMHRQVRRTARALAPLLALPSAPLPEGLCPRFGDPGPGPVTELVDCEEPLALCHGLARPRVVLTTGLVGSLSHDEIEAVLRHEWAHCARRDPLRLVVARALAEGLPGVPLLQRIAAAVPVAQELAADRSVIQALGVEALGRALLKVGDGQGFLLGQELAIGAFSAVDARLDQLLGEAPCAELPSSRALLPAAGLLLLSPAICLGLSFSWCVALAPALAIAARVQSLHAGAEPASAAD
ncbi:MAG TPA: M56 family metallopeptidase [Chloroflexota bacterium]|nr:M56 family metallopeptidase [Chloroflexota bacterium]